MAELTHDELDLVVMGQVMAGCFSGETSSHRGMERGKSYPVFHHNGVWCMVYGSVKRRSFFSTPLATGGTKQSRPATCRVEW